MKGRVACFHVMLILAAALGVLLLIPGNSFATTLFNDLNAGNQITINDTIHNSAYNGGSPALGPAGEDNETEMKDGGGNTVTSQIWDLEGMYWNATLKTVTIIGGFDFANGVKGYSIGDLFLGHFDGYYDANHDYGKKYVADYAIDFDNTGKIYQSVTNNPLGTSVVSYVNPYSNPYAYSDGGEDIGSVSYSTGKVPDAPFFQWDMTGTHYYLQISGLGEIADVINSGAIFHITMGCGNDAMRAAVPEPTTILLSGLGLLGMGAYLRRRTRRS